MLGLLVFVAILAPAVAAAAADLRAAPAGSDALTFDVEGVVWVRRNILRSAWGVTQRAGPAPEELATMP